MLDITQIKASNTQYTSWKLDDDLKKSLKIVSKKGYKPPKISSKEFKSFWNIKGKQAS